MYAYRNPDKLGSKDTWIQWVFQLRQKDKRHAVEFVEGWDAARIATAAIVPWLGSCVVGIGWTLAGGDPQTTFTVASFILTSSSSKSPNRTKVARKISKVLSSSPCIACHSQRYRVTKGYHGVLTWDDIQTMIVFLQMKRTGGREYLSRLT